MDVLYPAKHIKKQDFSGKLLIDGDLEDNCILFRFLFDAPEMVHPLIVSIKALPIALLGSCSQEHSGQDGKTFVFECNIPDFSNPVMKTRLIFPEFSIREHKIRVTRIESQVSCCFRDSDSRDASK